MWNVDIVSRGLYVFGYVYVIVCMWVCICLNVCVCESSHHMTKNPKSKKTNILSNN